MINRKNVIRYCCDDISLIKNYDEAVISNEKYDCHHLLESDYSRQELIDLNLYWDRPASELIFIKHKDHISLHHKLNTYDFMHKLYKHNIETIAKIALANTGKKRSEETKLKMSLAHRKAGQEPGSYPNIISNYLLN